MRDIVGLFRNNCFESGESFGQRRRGLVAVFRDAGDEGVALAAEIVFKSRKSLRKRRGYAVSVIDQPLRRVAGFFYQSAGDGGHAFRHQRPGPISLFGYVSDDFFAMTAEAFLEGRKPFCQRRSDTIAMFGNAPVTVSPLVRDAQSLRKPQALH